ncbi:MAG TPA: hypothetical protein GX707_14990 [Epulopiscium sp.]|nr:hypothetical protein [Candidatus Epulonipiscium sp.]
MKSNRIKEEACSTYLHYINLILTFGKGLMFAKHITIYMAHFNNYNKTKVWRDLRDMQNDEIIEINKHHNSNYIRLKKYPLRYLAELNNPGEKFQSKDISSLVFTDTLLRKSLFINQYVITKMLKDNVDLVNFMFHMELRTTLFAKAKDNVHIFEQYFPKREALNAEIHNLKQLKNLRTYNLRNASSKQLAKNSNFNINNMQSRNIFITELTDTRIVVTFFDIFNNYTPQKIINDMQATYQYLFNILTESTDISFRQKSIVFNIVVAKTAYKDRILKNKDILNRSLGSILGNGVVLGITDLKIDKTCFSNVKLLF